MIPCANGTDALQIALMALGLKPGDEVIVPAFTYVASAEVIALLGLTPVLVDVDPQTFNVTAEHLSQGLSSRTKAIIPVHLFGQSCDMEPILDFAHRHQLYVIEDNAQSLGSEYTFSNGQTKKTGTIGTIGCTSFFPSKNLGCYGDGGAICTNDDALAQRITMIANHGQREKYHHEVIGCNSRLDAIQAAILDVKLCHLDLYNQRRQTAAKLYDHLLGTLTEVSLPHRDAHSTHVFHQYTLQIDVALRDSLRSHLASNGIPSMIYYPLPLHKQPAFRHVGRQAGPLDNADELANRVLSIPMHTELSPTQQRHITDTIIQFYNNL